MAGIALKDGRQVLGAQEAETLQGGPYLIKRCLRAHAYSYPAHLEPEPEPFTILSRGASDFYV